MKKVVNIHAYLKVLETIWEKRGWRLVAEDEFMPRTDGKGLIYYQRSMFDPVWIHENPEQWPLAVYALKHEANHNLPNQKNIFKYIRKEKKNMMGFVGNCANLLWDELNDRLGIRSGIDLEGRLVFCETKWKVTEPTEYLRQSIMHSLFVWDCVNRCTWNELLIPYSTKVVHRPDEKEQKWMDVLLRSNYYDKLVHLSRFNEEDRGVALWNLTEEILRDVFDYEEEDPPNTPTPEGEGGAESTEKESDSSEDADGAESSDENVKGKVTSPSEPKKKKDEKKQEDKVIDYEDMLVSPHVSDADVTTMDTSVSEKLRIDYTKYKGRRYYRHYLRDEFTVVDFETGDISRAKNRQA